MDQKIRSLALACTEFIAGDLTLTTNASATEAKPAYKTLLLPPQLFPVGKWAEGIAATNQGIWVSESGQRTIVLLNATTGRVIRRVNVGRIPMEITAGSANNVSVLIQTDRSIWRQPAQGPGKSLRGLPGRPNGLARSGSALWALTQPACTSESSQFIRIDLKTGSKTKTGFLGEWGQALSVSNGKMYVVYARPPAMNIVDQKTMAVVTVDLQDLSLWSTVAFPEKVLVRGRLNSDWNRGVVAAVDPATSAEHRRQLLDQTMVALAADSENVVAVGEKGRIWVLSLNDLSLQSVIDLSTGPFKARAAAIQSGSLYVTSREHAGINGTVFAISAWR
jgi:hypothetical protein